MEDLWRDGHQVTAVSDVSIDLAAGEVLGLVGESGSGKSSLAKCIVGLVEVSQGKIRFDGADLARPADWRDPDLRRKMQMVFQNPDTALNPSHSVRRILRRAAKLLSKRATDAELESADFLARRVGSPAAAASGPSADPRFPAA